jgi:hypothetical protein
VRDVIGWVCGTLGAALLLGACLAHLTGVQGRGRHRAPDVAHMVHVPDPHMWQMPDPHRARWRRWARRAERQRWTGEWLPPLAAEEVLAAAGDKGAPLDRTAGVGRRRRPCPAVSAR